jgi:hypothetical protein
MTSLPLEQASPVHGTMNVRLNIIHPVVTSCFCFIFASPFVRLTRRINGGAITPSAATDC